jgi:hypothetical protein
LTCANALAAVTGLVLGGGVRAVSGVWVEDVAAGDEPLILMVWVGRHPDVRPILGDEYAVLAWMSLRMPLRHGDVGMPGEVAGRPSFRYVIL